MKDKILPEERLLRLIRDKKKPSFTPEAAPPSTPEVAKVKRMRTPEVRVDYRLINRLLAITLIISCIYLAAVYLYPLVGLKKISLPPAAVENIAERETPEKDAPKALAAYLAVAGGRNIFGSPVSQENGISAVKGEAESIKEISLVGIISGDAPEAIIEDKRTQQTYTLSKGQSIGEFQVEEILEGRVILSSRGRRYELNI